MMRARNTGLSTGALLACHDAERTRSRGLLLLLGGVAGVSPLAAVRRACEHLLAQDISTGVTFRWHDVADQRDLRAVDPRLDPAAVVHLEATEFLGLDDDDLAAILGQALPRLARCEAEIFPSAASAVGGVAAGVHFLGRQGELTRLTRWLEEGQNLLLVAPRRTGKTSLLRELERRLAPRARYVKLEDLATPGALWDSITRRVAPGTRLPDHDERQAWQTAAGALRGLPHSLFLLLDEFVWFLHNVIADDPAAARSLTLTVLTDLARLLSETGTRAVVAGSARLDEYLDDVVGLTRDEWPVEWREMARFALPPLGSSPRELRRLLLGTGLVGAPEDVAWLVEHVDLGLPHPAMLFLNDIASRARNGAKLDAPALDAALQRFLGETTAFREFTERLNRRAALGPGVRAAVGALLDALARDGRGISRDDALRLLGRAGSHKLEELLFWTVESFPLCQENDTVALGSRLFARWWREGR